MAYACFDAYSDGGVDSFSYIPKRRNLASNPPFQDLIDSHSPEGSVEIRYKRLLDFYSLDRVHSLVQGVHQSLASVCQGKGGYVSPWPCQYYL